MAIYLIVDLAYPLLLYCLNEHESGKFNIEVVFNVILRSAKNPIEYL